MFKKLPFLLLFFICFSAALQARDVSLAENNLLLTSNHGGDGSAWGLAACANCHVLRNIHDTAPKIRDIVRKTAYASCTGCHGKNGTNAQRQCLLCHNETLLAKKPIMQSIKNHNFTVKEDHTLTDKDCLTCHIASDMDGKFEPAVDLTHYPQAIGLDLPYRTGSEFCLRCHTNKRQQQTGFKMQARFQHDPLLDMAINYQYIDVHGKVKGVGDRTYTGLRAGYHYKTHVECTDCHAMHGTHNQKLLVDRTDAGMSLLQDSLRNRAIRIDTANENYAQLCVSCHKVTGNTVEDSDMDTGNGLSGVHQVGGRCIECHAHGMAVQTGL